MALSRLISFNFIKVNLFNANLLNSILTYLMLLKISNHICPIHSITQLINLNNNYDSYKCITSNSNLNNLFGQWGGETLVNLKKIGKTKRIREER